jgi:phosphoribosyl 1,2-cyclic phosphodiesterase
MKIQVLRSSSKGNGYILTEGNETLVIEAGVSFSEVKQALNFNISCIKGVCISHEHGDHSKYIKEYINAGLTVLALPEVFEKWKIKSHFAKEIELGKGYRIGNFSIIPFEAKHDVPCVGYLIIHESYGKIIFLTDTFYSKYTFKDLKLIMIECNYSDEILDKNISSGKLPYVMKKRLLTSHIGLDTTIEFLKANDLTKTDAILLLHLSDGNSNEKKFIEQVRKQTGIPTYVLDKNQQYNFN